MITSVGLGVMSLLVCVPAALGASQTFTSSTAMTLPAFGNASVYPSTIDVSGLAGSITDVNVELKGISDSDVSEVSAVVIAPGGQSLGIIDGAGVLAGGSHSVSDLDFLLDDQAAATFSDNSVPSASGSFRPHFFQIRDFPAPGPRSSYGEPATLGADTFASIFNGTVPTGTWSLFVHQFGGGTGAIARGWSIQITTDAPDPTPTDPTPTPTDPTPPVVTPSADTAKPTVRISKVTTKKGKRKATVEFSGADDRTAAAALTFTCQLDSEPAGACSSPATFKGLRFGKHTIAVRSVDGAGNASDPASDSFKIKRKPKHH